MQAQLDKPTGSLWDAKWPVVRCSKCNSPATHLTAAMRMGKTTSDGAAPLSVGMHCTNCGTDFALANAWWVFEGNRVEVRT